MDWTALTGKLLVFASGLTAVIDIADPGKLRARGVRARRRAALAARRRRRLVEIHDMVYLRQALMLHFVQCRIHADRTVVVSFCHLVETPPTRSPMSGVLPSTFTTFWHRTMADARRIFDIEDNHDNDKVTVAEVYISREVDNFVRSVSPPHKKWLVDQSKVAQNRAGLVSIFLLMLTLAAVGGIFWLVQDWGVAGAVIGMVALLTLPPTVFAYAGSPGLIRAFLWKALAWPMMWSARMLNRHRPLHPFRKIALAFFILGSAIDVYTLFR